MNFPYVAVIVAALAQFIFSAIWYTPVFGKTWGRIHGYDKVSPERQKEMMRSMPPFLALQLLVTLVTTAVLAIFITNLQGWNPYGMAGFFWLGFVVPTQVGAVVFGGTEPRWMLKKTLIMAGASFISLMIGAAIIVAFQ